ncbi:vWA domain-containing protein [Sellimonas sp.]|uniref:vWA domain-containing protein n=1 Tax=Sellimonas sp. TaxID=2021466 RepID=UPI00257FC753|nr:VWA-like domain-containing protein [Sellimonas sp.]
METNETQQGEFSVQVEAIGKEILYVARNELYLKMRFMDVAFSSLRFSMDPEIQNIGTDGEMIWFHPAWLGGAYREDRRIVCRAYLHMVLHCLFGHLFVRGRREREFWDLSCNIAVESIIDSLSYPCVRMPMSYLRKEIYRRIRQETKVMTAQKIYAVITAWGMTETERVRVFEEFAADSHLFWPSPDEQKKTPNETENSWKEKSQQMELNLDTFANDQAKGAGSLLEQLRIENRKRYDYRDFLRKFSVWKEEIGIDQDAFDYGFYSYGLSLYGNMPLIEPQETKEVKKIEEFVIVIDTSMSCSGELVKKFLEETYDVLSQNNSFFRKVHIHILQCDERVQEDVKIEKEEDLKNYMDNLELRGGGGTDFRPAFVHIEEMKEQHIFRNLRGVIYFTDGQGIYPSRRPSFDTAFVFLEEEGKDIHVPAWAVKLVLEESIFMDEERNEQDEY